MIEITRAENAQFGEQLFQVEELQSLDALTADAGGSGSNCNCCNDVEENA